MVNVKKTIQTGDTDVIEISEKAKAICKKHYITCWKGNGCHKCPISETCQSTVAPTEEGLNAWRSKLNYEAKLVLNGDCDEKEI